MENRQATYNELTRIASVLDLADVMAPLKKTFENKDKTIHVAVFGQFKSGKSSLINHLTSCDVMPVGVVPVTAIVTLLKYGENEAAVIDFEDNRKTEIPVSSVDEYVSEKKNPANTKHVAFATVHSPALEELKNITFADTPGLGSLYKHNTDVTEKWLPYAGISLVAVSAERPMAAEDINLIKSLSLYCSDVAVIITKTDLFEEAYLLEIESHINTAVKENFKQNISVYRYSVYNDSYRNFLIEHILKPVNNNPEQKLNEIIKHKLKAAREQLMFYAELSLNAALKREAAKDSIAEMLKDIQANRKHFERELLLSATSFKGEVREKLEKIVLPHHQNICDELCILFDNEFPLWKGLLITATANFRKWLCKGLEESITAIDNSKQEEIYKVVSETTSYFVYSAMRFRQLIDDKLYYELGVHLPELKFHIDFSGIARPDIAVYRVFDSHIDTLLFFIPMKLFRNLFRGSFRRQIPQEVNKNLNRYISDINGKIIRTIEAHHKQTLEFSYNETQSLEKILTQEKTNKEVLEIEIEKLRGIL